MAVAFRQQLRAYVQSSGAVVEKADTKNRILDAAEALFAQSGFDAVPVRKIMQEAETRLGLMSYYFESKEALLNAVVERRIETLNTRRRNLLKAALDEGDISVEKLVDCLVKPYADLIKEEGEAWRSYAKLNAHLSQSPRWASLIQKYFDSILTLIIDELAKLYPSASRATALRAVVMAVGTILSVLAESGRMQSLSDGYVRDDDLDVILPELCRFVSGGLRAALEQ